VPEDRIDSRPRGLLLAASAVTAVGLAVTGWSGYEALRLLTSTPENRSVAVGTTLYFATFGLLVLLVAGALFRRQRWAYGAAAFVLVLAAAIALVMVQGRFWWGAVPLGATTVGGLLGLLRADTRTALGRGG